ncbi:MAG: glycosyltransferase [Pseudomonadota bacterium]
MFASLPPDLKIIRSAGGLDSRNEPHPRPYYASMPSLDGGDDTVIAMAKAVLASCRDCPPTIVFAAGPRFSNFVAALLIARWAGAKLVLLYMDEWGVHTPPFVTVAENDTKWERRCLAAADAICYVTEGKRAAYENAFPFLRNKVGRVFPNGWDPRAFSLAAMRTEHLQEHAGRFRISFVGRAAQHTPIEPFLDVLDEVFKLHPELSNVIRLLLIGNQLPSTHRSMAAFDTRHPGTAQIMPAVPQNHAVEMMRESDALLLLNLTAYNGVITQKTYDYLNVPKPILAFGAISDAARLVEDAEAGVVVSDLTPLALTNALNTLLETPATRWDSALRRRCAERYNRDHLAEDFINFLLTLEKHNAE